jgi:hypothetical protein
MKKVYFEPDEIKSFYYQCYFEFTRYTYNKSVKGSSESRVLISGYINVAETLKKYFMNDERHKIEAIKEKVLRESSLERSIIYRVLISIRMM